MTLTELAKRLEISTAQASRLAKRGMPTDSVESAEAWRRVNLNPSWMTPWSPRGQVPADICARGGEQELAQARTAVAMGQRALEAGQLPSVIEVLRSALSAVPQGDRPQVRMSIALWDALTEDVHRVVAALEEPGAGAVHAPAVERPALSAFWYAAAAGEARVVAADGDAS